MRKMKVLQEKDGVTSYKGIAFYFYPMLKSLGSDLLKTSLNLII